MGMKVPPFIMALLRADALTVFKLRYFSGGDAKSLVISGAIRQPKATILAAMHGISPLVVLEASGRQAQVLAGPRHQHGLPPCLPATPAPPKGSPRPAGGPPRSPPHRSP